MKTSYSFNITNGYYLYNTSMLLPADFKSTTENITNFTKIKITIGKGGTAGDKYNDGGNGGDTILTITIPSTTDKNIVVFGGKGGKKGSDVIDGRAGNGGDGYYGGGGGVGGKFNYSGIGGKGTVDNSIYNGEDSNSDRNTSGRGGGTYLYNNKQHEIGGDNNNSKTNLTGENAGGGGGAGPAVIYKLSDEDIRRTGGRGAASFKIIENQSSTQGIDYTGAGGGGGSNNLGSGFMDPSRGGCGYAILWFHN
jgi:hypothetical protein